MKRFSRFLLVAVALRRCFLGCGKRAAPPVSKGHDEFDIIAIGRRIKGRIIDYTQNHGRDHRMWSRSLHQWRDLYVYVPPGYDVHEHYPVIYYLHPFAFDERTFLRIVPIIDAAIASGKMPPVIVVAPDGSLDGQGCLEKPGSFFINSNAGPYEDYILQDVWDFVCARFPFGPNAMLTSWPGCRWGLAPSTSAFAIATRSALSSAFTRRSTCVGRHGRQPAQIQPRRWGCAPVSTTRIR